MDPFTNLKQQVEIAIRIRSLSDSETAITNPFEVDREIRAYGEELAELVLSLSGWLARGGDVPDAQEARFAALTQLQAEGVEIW